MTTSREEVFNWADYEPTSDSTLQPAVYQPQPLVQMPQIPANVRVVNVPGQTPYYAYQPAPIPPHDPLPQRMAGAGIFLAGAGLFSICLGAGSLLFFKGLSMADHALVALAIVFVSGAVAFFIAKAGTGIRVSHVRIGDNSSFNIGGKR